MLGWFEWDEVHQCLRVVIPPWDCVDAPRQPADVVQLRIDAMQKRIMAMDLVAGHGSRFGSCYTNAATWVPDGLLELGATREEIAAVLQLTSVLGIHTMSLAAPILEEELAHAHIRGGAASHAMPTN